MNGDLEEKDAQTAQSAGETQSAAEPAPQAEGASDAGAQDAAALLSEQVRTLEREREELKNSMLRALAETDNVRKRANRQIEEARLYAVEKFARDLLNVADNLSRALESVPDHSRGIMTDAVKTALEGVELTQKELVTVLARHGVTAIDTPPGATFDPNLHQAVTQIPSEHAAGSIAQLFQSGWRIGERTLRAAMVAVSAGPGMKQ